MSTTANSALAGAGTGAAVGATFGPVGAAVGGVIGGLAGYFAAASDENATQKEKDAYNEMLKQAAKQYGVGVDELSKTVQDYYKNKGSLLSESDKREYKDVLTNTDWESLGAVDFDKDAYDVKDYYDQNRQQLVNAAENDALGAANVSGSVLGSGAVGNMVSAAVSTEKDLADKAFQRMTEDRNFDYGLAKDSATQKLEAVKNKINALGTAYGEDEEDQENYLQTMLGLANQKNNANLTAFMSQQV